MTDFNSIPGDLAHPLVFNEIDASNAVPGASTAPQALLVFGQCLCSKNAYANVAKPINSVADAAAISGYGSQFEVACRTALAGKGTVPMFGIPIADPAGSKSTRDLTFTGTATAAGVISLLVHGQLVQAGVAVGDDGTDCASSVKAAVNNANPVLMVSADSSAGVATLTARNQGELVGNIPVTLNPRDNDALPAGISCTVGALTPGTGTPSLTTALANLGEVLYTVVVVPWHDQLSAVETVMQNRWLPIPALRGAVASANVDAYADQVSFLCTRNNFLEGVMVPDGNCQSPETVWAAALGALVARVNIVDTGIPYHDEPLVGCVPAKASGDRFDFTERNELLKLGGIPYYVDPSGVVRVVRGVTTYTQTPGGSPDKTWQQLNRPHQVAEFCYLQRAYIGQTMNKKKLFPDEEKIEEGSNAIQPKTFKRMMVAFYKGLAGKKVVNADAYAASFQVGINPGDSTRIDFQDFPQFPGQLEVVAAKNSVKFA